MGINKLFDRGALLFPDRACLVDSDVSRTYREVASRRDQIAAAIIERFGERARCAVYSRNSAGAFECVFGIYRAGGVFVPLAAKSHIDEAAAFIEDCRVVLVFYGLELADEAAQLARRFPRVTFVMIDPGTGAAMDPDAWVQGRIGPPPVLNEDRDRLASIYGTGGTTGRPKGVMFTPLTWEIVAANLLAVLKLDTPPVYLVVAPMTHAAGTIAFPLFAEGATVVIQEKFDPGAVIDAIETHRVSHLFLPPTAIYMLIEHPGIRGRDFSSLRAFMYAAAPMAVAKLRQCIEIFGPVMMQFWGQTEAPMFCTCLMPQDHDLSDPEHERRLASCGRPMLLTRVEAMDDQGALLPPGEKGELVVRGNLVMAGYHENPAATEEASRFGWHHTGDVGYRDADGYVYIVDRKKDMIISGGMNVYPSEIEQVIFTHPAVKDCAVVGVPDEKWGEAVKAVLELKTGADATEGEIISHCKARLGSVKAPKSVEFWDTLPRTPVGKVSKKDIRSRFWQGRDRTI